MQSMLSGFFSGKRGIISIIIALAFSFTANAMFHDPYAKEKEYKKVEKSYKEEAPVVKEVPCEEQAYPKNECNNQDDQFPTKIDKTIEQTECQIEEKYNEQVEEKCFDQIDKTSQQTECQIEEECDEQIDDQYDKYGKFNISSEDNSYDQDECDDEYQDDQYDFSQQTTQQCGKINQYARDFTSRNFNCLNWRNRSIEDADYTGSRFHMVDMSYATITHTSFANTTLKDVKFKGARFRGVTFAGASFKPFVCFNGAKVWVPNEIIKSWRVSGGSDKYGRNISTAPTYTGSKSLKVTKGDQISQEDGSWITFSKTTRRQLERFLEIKRHHWHG